MVLPVSSCQRHFRVVPGPFVVVLQFFSQSSVGQLVTMSAAEDDTELRDLLIQNLENSGVLNKLKV